MRVFILSAEHFSVPGLVLQAHATRASAVAEAIELTETMVGDSSYVEWEAVTDSTWESIVGKLQDAHGAAHCYVDIAETELRGAPAFAATLQIAKEALLYAAAKVLDKPDWQPGEYAQLMQAKEHIERTLAAANA